MHPQNVRSVEQGNGVENGGAVFRIRLLAQQFPDERLARYADEDRVVVMAVTIKVAEQGVVRFEAFAKSYARVEDDPLVAVSLQHVTLLFEEVEHRLVDVAVQLILVHRLGRAHAMHQHVGDVVLADVRQHLRVEETARDVVDDVGAHVLAKGADGDFRFGEMLADGLEHRNDPLEFLLFRSDGIVGPGGASADVDEVGPLFQHLFTMQESRVNGVVFSPVGERVRRDVQDAHDGREGVGHFSEIWCKDKAF